MKFPTSELHRLFEASEGPIEGIITVFGEFGVGKTTFALQTAINDAKEGKYGVYIYSKPAFPNEKVKGLLSGIPSEIQSEILDKIIFIQTTNFTDLNDIVFNLEFLILSNLKEKDKILNFIVIDSITDLYRLEFERDIKSKNVKLNSQLNQLMANLFYINETYSIEILLVNESVRKTEDEKTIEVQAGGNVMDYWIKYTININRTQNVNERKFKITKHPEGLRLEFVSTMTEQGFQSSPPSRD